MNTATEPRYRVHDLRFAGTVGVHTLTQAERYLGVTELWETDDQPDVWFTDDGTAFVELVRS